MDEVLSEVAELALQMKQLKETISNYEATIQIQTSLCTSLRADLQRVKNQLRDKTIVLTGLMQRGGA